MLTALITSATFGAIGTSVLGIWKAVARLFPRPVSRGPCPACGHAISCVADAREFACFFCNKTVHNAGRFYL